MKKGLTTKIAAANLRRLAKAGRVPIAEKYFIGMDLANGKSTTVKIIYRKGKIIKHSIVPQHPIWWRIASWFVTKILTGGERKRP